AAGVAGLIKKHAAGEVPTGKTIVITVTGHGLKDPQWALRTEDGSDVSPVKVQNDVVSVAAALGFEG
ncbi:MAG: threonine synthase, partial [Arthrobacter sp.]|nr:threonine synthase [Arthrobacter sp.]